jgi:UDP-N-acetylglucosamine/UDP-N-acetylgalactosamine diphosphorylase
MASFITAELRARYTAAGQEQVFKFADAGKLSAEQGATLVAQLEKLDLDRIAKLHTDAMEFDAHGQDSLGELQALESYDSIATSTPEQIDGWQKAGFDAIAKGECAALVLSGGAGTRLGFPFPKGMYSIGLPSGKTLFQLFAERLLALSALSGSGKTIPWYIMTSEGDNHSHTVKFFADNNYFGYDPKDVIMFSQGTLPCMTLEGKLMLETGFKVGAAADGNGGIYGAIQQTGNVADMKARGIKYVHCFSVDNAIGKVCDPVFLGYCINKGSDVGNKVVWKAEPGEAVGVIGRRGGKSAVIEYSEMSEADMEKVDENGKLVYGAGNICNHFYTTEFLENVTDDQLIFHVARKKIPEPAEDGQTKVTPTANTGIKLECFIFDCFSASKNMAVLEGPRDEEFSPVKNAPLNPKDSPDSARIMLSEQNKKWLKAAGIDVIEGAGQVEIGPFVTYRGEGLEKVKQMLNGGQLDCRRDVYIDVTAPGGSTPRSISLGGVTAPNPTGGSAKPSAEEYDELIAILLDEVERLKAGK